VVQLRNEAQELKESNEKLQEAIKDLKVSSHLVIPVQHHFRVLWSLIGICSSIDVSFFSVANRSRVTEFVNNIPFCHISSIAAIYL
jgi:hypothetical protein